MVTARELARADSPGPSEPSPCSEFPSFSVQIGRITSIYYRALVGRTATGQTTM
jgi:hypothetical protein